MAPDGKGWACRLFPPAEPRTFRRYRKVHHLDVPEQLRPLLCTANGCAAFGLDLFGMSPSMLEEPALLDRSRPQCYDLSLANEDWRHEFRGGEAGFHFGGRSYSNTENSGYFLFGKRDFVALLKDGSALGRWDNLTALLADELAAAEQHELSATPSEWWH